MTCMKAQSLITPFIDDNLNIAELEEFVTHIHDCPDCREELEVYYALLTAMRQLDEDKNLSDDFNQELTVKLQKAQERIIHTKFTYYRKKGVLFLVIIVMAALINIYHAFFHGEEENMLVESTFQLRTEFRDERFDVYDAAIRSYLFNHRFLDNIDVNH